MEDCNNACSPSVSETPAPVADVAPKTESTYDTFLTELNSQWVKFMAEAKEGGNNKAAALRARKLSLTMRKNLQEFREVSIANDKAATK